MERDDEHDRAARRKAWPGRLVRLGDEPVDPPLSPERALAAMRPLAERAWRLTGKPFPRYTRDQMPGRVIRGSEGKGGGSG